MPDPWLPDYQVSALVDYMLTLHNHRLPADLSIEARTAREE
jgi:hypothetical protein